MLLFNRLAGLLRNSIMSISKHLMLLFNATIPELFSTLWEFQNISCYCLTDSVDKASCCSFGFQNISCYCLTMVEAYGKGELSKFQNISCYCLTKLVWECPNCGNRFQNISCYCLTFIDVKYTILNCISKHLMLLFN